MVILELLSFIFLWEDLSTNSKINCPRLKVCFDLQAYINLCLYLRSDEGETSDHTCCQTELCNASKQTDKPTNIQHLLLCGELDGYPPLAVLSTSATPFPFLPIQNAPRV